MEHMAEETFVILYKISLPFSGRTVSMHTLYAYNINSLALNPKGNFQELLVLCLCGPINALH